ncbi:exonuclease domain-containing protein [Tropicimonas sp. TH_r6]|uniref:exonuclease domain-containing protein n=1 Tax=Tropicimonas sp. TH_r6 TaxID=3082085 RepID=UPI002952AF32|nr:exonuclease domain-containing protein [Tropicimonas sp. TH_r6]MDV7144825.1 exonuclease domain-containing protein [Tropicimonas sp. TH_r6]
MDIRPVPALPDGPFRFIALDVETACSDSASLCQIGLACVAPEGRIAGWSCLIDPETRFDRFNSELHGIDARAVAEAPRFPEAWEALLPLLRVHHLVQHSNFDRRAIEAACKAYRLSAPDLSWSDSVKIARRAWPEFRGNGGHGLGHLKTALGLEFDHHDAGEDARAAAEVVLKAETRLGLGFEEIAGTRGKAQMSFLLG